MSYDLPEGYNFESALGKTKMPYAVQGFMYCVLSGCHAGDSKQEWIESYRNYMSRRDVADEVVTCFSEHTGNAMFSNATNPTGYRMMVAYFERKVDKFFKNVSFVLTDSGITKLDLLFKTVIIFNFLISFFAAR